MENIYKLQLKLTVVNLLLVGWCEWNYQTVNFSVASKLKIFCARYRVWLLMNIKYLIKKTLMSWSYQTILESAMQVQCKKYRFRSQKKVWMPSSLYVHTRSIGMSF